MASLDQEYLHSMGQGQQQHSADLERVKGPQRPTDPVNQEQRPGPGPTVPSNRDCGLFASCGPDQGPLCLRAVAKDNRMSTDIRMNGISPGTTRDAGSPRGKTGFAESQRLRSLPFVEAISFKKFTIVTLWEEQYPAAALYLHLHAEDINPLLICEEQSPAAVSCQQLNAEEEKHLKTWAHLINLRFLLAIAGDIESNPGPRSKDPKKCDHPDCQETVLKTSFFKCEDCDAVCHKKKACSGINRGLSRPWWCKAHRDNNTNQDNFDDRPPCSFCGVKFRCNQTPLKCPDCEALCHQTFGCSKIPAYNKTMVWKCADHTGGENDRQICFACPRFIGKRDSYKCQLCDIHVHKASKCSGIPKGTKYPVWNCGGHGTEAAPDPCLIYPLCVTCGISISPENALTCQDCSRVCHKSFDCCKIKRNNRRPGNGLQGYWNCGNHTYPPGSKCDDCNLNLNEDSDTFTCSQCNEAKCHTIAYCSNIKARQKDKTWTCKSCLKGPEPVEEEPEQEPLEETLHPEPQTENQPACHACPRPFRKYYSPYRCEICNVASHRGEQCSGVKRWHPTESWNCGKHHEEPTPETPVNPPDIIAYKGPCAVPTCKTPIKSNHSRIKCLEDGCDNRVHHKCSEMNKEQIKEYLNGERKWSCTQCLTKMRSSNHRTVLCEDLPETDLTHEDKMKSHERLRILQWNADGLSNKILELRQRAVDDDIDIILIQETHLEKRHSTPSIPDYSAFRTDRKNKEGGGIISYIKKSLIFEKRLEQSKDGTEIQSFYVQMSKNQRIEITNLYCPPTTSAAFAGQNLRLATEIIPAGSNHLIAGDFNAHCAVWDEIQPPDSRGDEMIDWIIDNELTILNDGSPTCANRTTGGESTPDVTICGNTWWNKVSWNTVDSIGKSDHQPILVEVNAKVKHVSPLNRTAKWKSRDVDWEAFSKAVDEKIVESDPANPLSIREEVDRFTKALLDSATTHVGKIKPSKKRNSWMTPTVRAAIRKRNALRRTIKTHRKEWMEACKEAREETVKAKEDAWREFLADATESTDEGKIWNVIRSLNGTPESNSPNEVMVHEGRKITSPTAKANAFVEHYANVSNLKFSKEDRVTNRLFRKRLDNLSDQDLEEIPPFTMAELKRAIKKMKPKGAPGPDNIPPSFLKNLGVKALEKLLSIFNRSLSQGELPQIWRNAIIIPLLKQGKPASSLASFRPISLTSCVVKLMERMLAERLYYLAESNGWFSNLQAGFRKGRGCEDQILKITQGIEDAFNRTPRQSSVLVLLDFSKAYDTVWRQKLLSSMLDKGVPKLYVRWLYRFLQNRQARVRYDGTLGKSKQIKQGLPQGSVLAPLLFLFYINNLADLLPDYNINALFADDVSILASDNSKERATAKAQAAVDIVIEWSKIWKLNLNADKSECSFFSTAPLEAKYKPRIIINKKIIKVERNPRLLGVFLDCKLSFNHHVKVVSKKIGSKMRMLAAVSNAEWGWRKHELKKLFTSHVRGVFDYAGLAWQPWLSDSQINNLDVCQNKAIRLITRQAKSAPVESLRLEARIPSITSVMETTCETAREKALRQPLSHPRRACLDQDPPIRLLSRNSCRRKGIELSANLPAEAANRRHFELFTVPPWNQDLGLTVVNSHLEGISGKNDDPELIRATAIKTINSFDMKTVIYTDGSVL